MLIPPLLLILLPLAELLVIIVVGQWIGALPTIGLLLLISLLGAWLIRYQGVRVWRSLTQTVAERKSPQRGVVNRAMLMLAGVLLLIPGFITDVIALLLIIPLTRFLLGRVMVALVARRVGSRRRVGTITVESQRVTFGPEKDRTIEGEIDERRDGPAQ